jgi:hypothetical protein
MDNIENILTLNSINSVDKLIEHYYDLHKYINPNLFNLIDNYQLIIYFIIILIILYIAKKTKNTSYTIISIFLFILLLYNDHKKFYSKHLDRSKQRIELIKIGISENSLINGNPELIKILYDADFIRNKSNKSYSNLINMIEYYLTIYETLKQNVNNIKLRKDSMIKPFKLNKSHHSILINDLRDQLEAILNFNDTFIHILPNEDIYLEAYYQFKQLIKLYLSRYYNEILTIYNYIDHASNYELYRTETKYGFLY